MREFYNLLAKTSKFPVKERKLKEYTYSIEKTEVFLSLEFFATWVMEREEAIRVIKLSHIGFLAQ
jgi:hypothetical protein